MQTIKEFFIEKVIGDEGYISLAPLKQNINNPALQEFVESVNTCSNYITTKKYIDIGF